jgi:hypothetical protein
MDRLVTAVFGRESIRELDDEDENWEMKPAKTEEVQEVDWNLPNEEFPGMTLKTSDVPTSHELLLECSP